MVVRDVHDIKSERHHVKSELSRGVEAGITRVAVFLARHYRLLIDEGNVSGCNVICDVGIHREKVVLLFAISSVVCVGVNVRVDEVITRRDKTDVHSGIRVVKSSGFKRLCGFVGFDFLLRFVDEIL